MNITELARRLKVPTSELKERLPELGFDIGMRAIKVDDRIANQIIAAWKKEERRSRLEQRVIAAKEEQIKQTAQAVEGRDVVMLPPTISVRDLAAKFAMPIPAMIAELMRNGVMASISDKVDYEIAAIVAENLGLTTEQGEDISIEQQKAEKMLSEIRGIKTHTEGELITRPPVVVVMGHVDHGKTKLLDTIRQAAVADGESGGITQHIGAYQVEREGRSITFIDTPGHQAFSHMRSRGAVVADVAILVVAADDGVQPQTVEAIKMIQDAKIPFVVAINKIDKPEANVETVKKGLSELNILVEDWGGDVPAVPISAKENTNIEELLEMVLLVADVNKEALQTRLDGPARGVIIESNIDSAIGAVATVLVHTGTMSVGDSFQVGDVLGKIRAMKNYKNEAIEQAPPSTPIRIIGLSDVAEVGLVLTTGVDLKKLRRQQNKKHSAKSTSTIATVDRSDGEDEVVYPIILKADVGGSLEAIEHALREIKAKDARVQVISKALGPVTEIDVVRAAEDHAKIFAFQVLPTKSARELALEKGVHIEQHQVIYSLLDVVKKDVELLLKPEIIRHDQGEVSVLKVFGKRNGELIIGGAVAKGVVEVTNKFVLYRDDRVMGEGDITQLRIGPDQHRAVNAGSECGLQVRVSTDIQPGDRLEAYYEEEKKRTLDQL